MVDEGIVSGGVESKIAGATEKGSVGAVGVVLELSIVAIVKTLKFLLNGTSLTTTHGAAACVLLLLLHLFEDGVFLELNETLTLLLAQVDPESLDAFALFVGVGIPEAVVGIASGGGMAMVVVLSFSWISGRILFLLFVTLVLLALCLGTSGLGITFRVGSVFNKYRALRRLGWVLGRAGSQRGVAIVFRGSGDRSVGR